MFDPLTLAKCLLHLLSAEHGDATPHDLLGGERTTKHGRRQNECFCDRIIAFYIIGWVGFGIALRLCFGESLA